MEFKREIKRVEGVPGLPPSASASASTRINPQEDVGSADFVDAADVPPATAEAEAAEPAVVSASPVKLLPDGTYEGVLEDGRVLVFETPKVATQFLIFEITGSSEAFKGNQDVYMMISALMYLKSIDGKAVNRPQNRTDAQQLMNKLGHEGTNFVTNVYVNYFVLKRVDLPKSERQSKATK